MNVALVSGALGIVGRALIEHLDSRDDWQAIGLSRRSPTFDTTARFIAVDLTDAASCQAALTDLGDVTHIFHSAVFVGNSPDEEVAPNLAMLVNLIDTVEPMAPGLAHVQLMQGTKWYGNHLGSFKTPAREDDPRIPGGNFYYAQQDWLEKRQKGTSWSWSGLRPHGIWGFSVGSPMSQLTGLGVYATISKQLGLPLCFPGKPGAFDGIYQLTEAAHLARGMVWAATEPRGANQAFNFTDGDYFRWRDLWPAIAGFFDMAPGPVETRSMETYMADKESLWAEIVAANGLHPFTLGDLVSWRFIDWVYGGEYDQMSSMTKARNAGWTGEVDSADMVLRQFQRLRDERIIP